jgi:hypothetical protein
MQVRTKEADERIPLYETDFVIFIDDWDILDGMTEEEATLLALEMSRTVEADAGD